MELWSLVPPPHFVTLESGHFIFFYFFFSIKWPHPSLSHRTIVRKRALKVPGRLRLSLFSVLNPP